MKSGLLLKNKTKSVWICNAAGPCPLGDPGGMVPIEPSGDDEAQLKDIVQNFGAQALGRALRFGMRQRVE